MVGICYCLRKFCGWIVWDIVCLILIKLIVIGMVVRNVICIVILIVIMY